MTSMHISACGESSLRVEFTSHDDESNWYAVHNLSRLLTLANPPGLYDAVPTYTSALIEFDPIRTDADIVKAFIELLADSHDLTQPISGGKTFLVPVVYGGEQGPDLPYVAKFLGIPEQEVIAIHTSKDLLVRCLGGPAASCMTDGPQFSKPIPRLPDPRLQVPERAISVAGKQGVIGPVQAPSGWRLIGVSPIDIMDPNLPGIVCYKPGDRIRFMAITDSEWDTYRDTPMQEMEVQS